MEGLGVKLRQKERGGKDLLESNANVVIIYYFCPFDFMSVIFVVSMISVYHSH
jgi:hypothetical protein